MVCMTYIIRENAVANAWTDDQEKMAVQHNGAGQPLNNYLNLIFPVLARRALHFARGW